MPFISCSSKIIRKPEYFFETTKLSNFFLIRLILTTASYFSNRSFTKTASWNSNFCENSTSNTICIEQRAGYTGWAEVEWCIGQERSTQAGESEYCCFGYYTIIFLKAKGGKTNRPTSLKIGNICKKSKYQYLLSVSGSKLC